MLQGTEDVRRLLDQLSRLQEQVESLRATVDEHLRSTLRSSPPPESSAFVRAFEYSRVGDDGY